MYFTVQEGEYKGSVVANFLNFVNRANADTEKYALNDLKKIATYIGVPNPNHIADTSVFFNGLIDVKVDEREVEGEDKTFKVSDVKGYFKVEGKAEAAATTTAAASSAPAKQPWEK